jgi:hypothetical protein
LNYALHDSVDALECRADLELKGLGGAPSPQDEGLGSQFRSQWAAADQLTAVRAAVCLFLKKGGVHRGGTYAQRAHDTQRKQEAALWQRFREFIE